MELTASCILINTIKRTSKKGVDYVQLSLLDNITSEPFLTYSNDSDILNMEKLKEYKFTFVYNNKFKNFKVIKTEKL